MESLLRTCTKRGVRINGRYYVAPDMTIGDAVWVEIPGGSLPDALMARVVGTDSYFRLRAETRPARPKQLSLF